MKIKTVILFMITATLLFTGCGEKVDDVINEMTLKGTVERSEKTKDIVKNVQKQYADNLKELQEFDNPTNSLKSGKKTK
jgi:protein involved in sex pheromone biosynthesis